MAARGDSEDIPIPQSLLFVSVMPPVLDSSLPATPDRPTGRGGLATPPTAETQNFDTPLQLGSQPLSQRIDDLWDIRPLYKLGAQIIAGILMMFSTGEYIQTIAYLPSGNTINIAELGYFITLFAVVGLINAFNMMDGIDGLAATQAILSIVLTFTSMFILKATFSNDIFIIFLLGALLGFLIPNLNLLPKTKVFLGDAGSMMLGFLIAWMLISYTQPPNKQGLPPSLALWVVAIPVADTLALCVRRILLKRSPFRPDRKHLHHICLRMGLSPRQSLAVICALSIISYLVGISTYLLFGEIVSIILFFVMIGLYYKIIKNIWRISSLFRRLI